MAHPETTQDRLARLLAAIGSAAKEAGRSPASVRLVAVTKTFEAPHIRPALEAGHRIFGENRVQEAARKWPVLREAFPDLQLHLIGPLQTNKAREAVRLFDAIHSIDRTRIAKCVAEEAARHGKQPQLFVQVNTGAEQQKAGIAVAETRTLVDYCRRELGLAIAGLMCIPPADADPTADFRLLAKLAGDLGLAELSMGMSADYAAAIACGATYVRVGSAIFGAR